MENKQVNKKSDNSKVILIVVILILLGVIGYLVFTNQEQGDTISNQEQKINADSLEKVKITKDLEDLQLTYQKLKEEHQALGLETDSLDAKIQELNETIRKVNNSKASEVRKWKNKLANMQVEFDSMKQKMELVARQNDTLNFKLDSMRVNDQRLADSIANLSTEKSELAAKVAIASVLKAENIKVSAINPKGKESTADAYKAKSIDKLKISFNLGDNKVAKKNSKEIYLRLMEPNGATLFEGDKTFSLDGKEVFYTEKRSVDFNNTKQLVGFIYQKGSAYKPGKYTVELYTEGSLIGSTNFVVK